MSTHVWRSRLLRAAAFTAVCSVVVVAGCSRETAVEQGPIQSNDGETQTVADFEARVKDYMALHRKLNEGVPKVPTEATPGQIDAHQRELAKRIGSARSELPRGSLFTDPMQKIARREFDRVFSTGDGRNIKASVMDENPAGTSLVVNQRYPDDVPLSTMPPELLQVLPRLPDGLEYRFVGPHLTILDVEAHIIVDYVPNAIPE
jgi:hypothetical protein